MLVRVFALMILIGQLGLIAHRIEHYVAPDHMECGEDACTAFMPTTGAADLPVVISPLFLVVFVLSFWTVRENAVRQHAGRLGFPAHAPPL